MTVIDHNQAPATVPDPASSRRPGPKGNPWLPTPRGVALVTRIELLRRRPTVKGWIFYGLLVALIVALGVLVSVASPDGKTSTPLELLLVMVLGAGMLIAPSLAATSINGDSSEGVLAPLQMTRLTAGDLAFGKLLASWLIAFAVLLTTAPLMIYGFSRSGWHLDELLIVLGAILLVVLTSTAIGLAWSSLAARAVASVSMAHLTTGFLLLGTLLAFALTQPLVSEPITATSRSIAWDQLTSEQQATLDNAYQTGDFSAVDVAALPCVDNTWDYQVAHTEQTAWLLLANPVVMIGEASPIINPETYEEDGRAEPGLFALMHQGVSGARLGPMAEQLDPNSSWYGGGFDECADLAATAAGESPDEEAIAEQEAQWAAEEEARAARSEAEATLEPAPWVGLGIQLVLLVGSMWVVVARLRVPYKKLRVGTRVA